ncbi:hypothetical protein ATANTOWER_009856 [Ataeniobius toweri]|uniref:Uncharacterized protein n=1 Tax=Ataeniobius toweri TaxID=208326 RepID=A0ABU7AQK7_9TELE|nr:hypothetical protein [Ataeniobius toweri]
MDRQQEENTFTTQCLTEKRFQSLSQRDTAESGEESQLLISRAQVLRRADGHLTPGRPGLFLPDAGARPESICMNHSATPGNEHNIQIFQE